jgi:hypothetical protein
VRAQIQVGDHPPVVVRGIGATAQRVAFRLELDEAPVPVRLTAIERRLPSAAACERTVERRVHGFRRIAVPSGCQLAKVRPRRLDMCTVDYGWSARRLTWRSWNGDTARGRGTWNAGCVPLRTGWRCPPPLLARFTLSAIRWCHTLDAYVYTRLRVRPRGERARTEELTCPSALA